MYEKTSFTQGFLFFIFLEGVGGVYWVKWGPTPIKCKVLKINKKQCVVPKYSMSE